MTRVGILTFHYAKNFGAMLQTFATLKILKEMGFSPTVINYVPILSKTSSTVIKPGDMGRKYKALNLPLNKTLRSMIGEVLYYTPLVFDEIARNRAFEDFRREILRIESEDIIRLEDLKRECLKYDLVIVGSDLVWHPDSLKYSDYAYLLPFKLESTLKMSFSASIGIDISTIPERLILIFKRCLKDFLFVSVREKIHAEWLSKVLGRNVYHTLDPTLMVDREIFEEVSRSTKSVSENYILFYNLDTSILPFVEDLEREIKMPILIYRKPTIREWGLYGKYVRGRESFYHVGPREFIELLKRANLVFTDSYHGLTMSLIFEKPVIVVINDSWRAKIKIRIEDLVKLLELNEIVIRDRKDLRRALRTEINYSDIKSRLSELRRKSINLLKNAIMGSNNR